MRKQNKTKPTKRAAKAEQVVDVVRSKPVAPVAKSTVATVTVKLPKPTKATAKAIKAVKAAGSTKAEPAIPAFLDRSSPEWKKKPTKAEKAKAEKALATARADGIKAAAGGGRAVAAAPEAAKALSAAERLKALLADKSGKRTNSLPKAVTDALVPPKGRAKVAPREPHVAMKAKDVKPGMKVRVYGLNEADTLSDVFTIQKLDKGEKTLGADWFAIDDRRQVHVDFLVEA